MFMLWISSQSFAQNARSSLATTDLASSLNRSRNDPSNGGDASKKTLYYTLWNGRFFMRYKGCLLWFRRQFLLDYKKSPEEAIDNVEQLTSKPIRVESKPPRMSEDAEPEDTQLV